MIHVTTYINQSEGPFLDYSNMDSSFSFIQSLLYINT